MNVTRRDLRKTISELQSTSETLRHGGQPQKLAENDNLKFPKCQHIKGEYSKSELRKRRPSHDAHFFCGELVKPGTSWCPKHHAAFFTKSALTEG